MVYLNAILIDDEINAIKTLEWEIDSLEMPIEVIEKFTNAQKAVDYLTYNSDKVDLIFLDIQMPTMSGLEFLDHFKVRDFEVIFVTAHDEYAIKAIKESALDYILKPVESSELKKSIKKLIAKKSASVKQRKSQPINKISIPIENKVVFIDPHDIIYCKSDGNYSHIFTKNDKFLISKTLKLVESMLPESLFYRIHQSSLINLSHIISFDRSSNYIKLINQKELPVSRSKQKDFLDQL